MPTRKKSAVRSPGAVYLIASGDLRLAANIQCTPAQLVMEKQIIAAFKGLGVAVKRAHPVDRDGHCFLDSQKYAMEVFRGIPPDAHLVVAEAVWQYSHHVLHGLIFHKGPILTVANWSGQWPGLVGMLNLNGSLTKANVPYTTLWSDDFTDAKFLSGLKNWLAGKPVKHDLSHVKPLVKTKLPAAALKLGQQFARKFREKKAIMGVFDEGCMGMYNAIIQDELLAPLGVFKERLSQSTLWAKMLTVTDEEARKIYDWYIARGVKFRFGPPPATEENDLTENQVVQQCKMYIAALRLADEFGCGTIGIQYQQGLKDLAPASDLVEGTLNNVERPPAFSEDGRELFPGEALPHFNEADECAGLDGLITYRLWRQLGLPPENTLHDIRWGRHYSGPGKYPDSTKSTVDDFVWVFEISGAVPPAHFANGWQGASSERQTPMFFRLGGGTLKGISKPGWVVWSRIYIESNKLQFDTGLAQVVELPQSETEDRWTSTTSEWPIMHAVLQGISRDQLMAKHKSNHIQVAYAPSKKDAIRALTAKAAAMQELGMPVNICGTL
ncbi:MAG: fucose isomerase [Phycisphaerales bacterium]|nr:fucose isomerase [Phycisphaerales bacterium]